MKLIEIIKGYLKTEVDSAVDVKDQDLSISEKERTPAAPRFVKRTSYRSYLVAKRTWNILLLSLPLDLLVYLPLKIITKPVPSSDRFLEWTTLLLVVLAVAGIFRHQVLRRYLDLDRLRYKLLELPSNKISIVVIGLTVTLFISEIIFKIVSHPSVGALITLMVLVGTGFAFVKDHLELRKEHTVIFKDRIFWIERANIEILIIVLLPMIAARLVSFVGALSVLLIGISYTWFSFYFIASVIMLFEMAPTRGLFMAPCKRCSFSTSIALQKVGCCPACNYQNFVTGKN